MFHVNLEKFHNVIPTYCLEKMICKIKNCNILHFNDFVSLISELKISKKIRIICNNSNIDKKLMKIYYHNVKLGSIYFNHNKLLAYPVPNRPVNPKYLIVYDNDSCTQECKNNFKTIVNKIVILDSSCLKIMQILLYKDIIRPLEQNFLGPFYMLLSNYGSRLSNMILNNYFVKDLINFMTFIITNYLLFHAVNLYDDQIASIVIVIYNIILLPWLL